MLQTEIPLEHPASSPSKHEGPHVTHPLLRTDKLVKIYGGRAVVNGVDIYCQRGEIVGLLDGVPRFGALADRMHLRDRTRAARLAEQNPVTLMVFDVLSVDGKDVTGEPLSMRRRLLEALDLNAERRMTPPTYEDGQSLLAATAAQGLEGIVSKKLSSRYEPGRRSKDWLKFANRPSSS